MTLSGLSADRILALHQAAKDSGALISVEEMLLLLPEHASEGELVLAISTMPALSSRLELRSGFITEKSADQRDSALSAESNSRARAVSNIRWARRFAPLIAGGSMRLIAISGSSSYRSASRSTDLDFFCVSRTGALWLQLARLLLLARAFRLTNRQSPEVCFSCMMDERYATEAFSRERGSLFARDALQTVVVDGEGSYQRLLRRAGWISALYPTLYAKRLDRSVSESGTVRKQSPAASALNAFLYVMLGSYIRVKSFLRNRRLSKQGRAEDLFDLLIGQDHLMLESARYRRLRESYGQADVPSEVAGAVTPGART